MILSSDSTARRKNGTASSALACDRCGRRVIGDPEVLAGLVEPGGHILCPACCATAVCPACGDYLYMGSGDGTCPQCGDGRRGGASTGTRRGRLRAGLGLLMRWFRPHVARS